MLALRCSTSADPSFRQCRLKNPIMSMSFTGLKLETEPLTWCMRRAEATIRYGENHEAIKVRTVRELISR